MRESRVACKCEWYVKQMGLASAGKRAVAACTTGTARHVGATSACLVDCLALLRSCCELRARRSHAHSNHTHTAQAPAAGPTTALQQQVASHERLISQPASSAHSQQHPPPGPTHAPTTLTPSRCAAAMAAASHTPAHAFGCAVTSDVQANEPAGSQCITCVTTCTHAPVFMKACAHSCSVPTHAHVHACTHAADTHTHTQTQARRSTAVGTTQPAAAGAQPPPPQKHTHTCTPHPTPAAAAAASVEGSALRPLAAVQVRGWRCVCGATNSRRSPMGRPFMACTGHVCVCVCVCVCARTFVRARVT
jgi:hypothetical protein